MQFSVSLGMQAPSKLSLTSPRVICTACLRRGSSSRFHSKGEAKQGAVVYTILGVFELSFIKAWRKASSRKERSPNMAAPLRPNRYMPSSLRGLRSIDAAEKLAREQIRRENAKAVARKAMLPRSQSTNLRVEHSSQQPTSKE